MIDKRQQDIKERISRYAMDMWGISDPTQMDPVIDLLLDVFAYNSNRLYQDMESSDSAILHRLARLLVPHKWSLPFPAHALMTVNPASSEVHALSIEDRFQTNRMIFSKGLVPISFTPLAAYPLVQAQVKCITFDDKMYTYFGDGRKMVSVLSKDKDDEDEHVIWLGIAISEETLLSTEALTLCVLPEDERLSPFIKDIKVYDTDNHSIHTHTPHFSLSDKEKYHYFDDINDYYADNYITIDLAEHPHRESLCCTAVPRVWKDNETEKQQDNLCWFKLQFPSIQFDVNFEEIRFLMNTFPVVNRALFSQKHDFSKEGSIISLPCNDDTHFLHIESLQDSKGRDYTDIRNHFEEYPVGAFSMYFGNLEKFDSDNARSLIIKLMQLLREEGNAFFSLDSDALDDQLGELYKKIEDMGKSAHDTIKQENKPKVFLLTYPEKDAENAELKYWVTDGALANGLDSRALLTQESKIKFMNSGLCFQTTTKQGTIHKNEQDLINSLRYGLLSRNRIVTQEDVRSYIFCKLGSSIKDIDIRDGVAISPDVRKGIVRTTEIRIKMKQRKENESDDFSATARFLEKELTKRSMSKIPYKVSFE